MDAPFSYGPVGATAGDLPVDHDHDVYSGIVGTDWHQARRALAAWRHFDIPWVRLLHPVPLVPGQGVAFAARALGLWTVNTCRIVYAVDEADRYGYAYGTLAGHSVAGEELFVLHREGESVRFELRKFSRLVDPRVRLVAPLARAVQRRFSVDAVAALGRALHS